jgi:hypothetical protein
MLILAKHTISFKMQGFLSIRCSALGKNDIPCQSKLLFPLVHACFQDMQQRSKHHSEYGPTGQHWILSISNIHWLKYNISQQQLLYYIMILPGRIFPSCFLMGLLSGPGSLLLPDVQATASSGGTTASKISNRAHQSQLFVYKLGPRWWLKTCKNNFWKPSRWRKTESNPCFNFFSVLIL